MKMLSVVLGSVVGITIFASQSFAVAQNLTGTVISIGDGDTLRVKVGNQPLTIRLACVDAPELAQKPFGDDSRRTLQQLLPINQSVTLQVVDRDRYGRTVAKVFKGNTAINLAMVQAGQAVVYPQYLKGCPELERALSTAEQFAKLERLGFWSQTNPVLPWDFRKGGTASSQHRQPTNTLGMPACVKTDCNCSDFSTQAEAQRVFNAYPGDPFGLDRDKDGVACEALK